MADNGNGGIANSDKIAPELFPGISSGLGSSAPGSQGASGPGSDSVQATVTPPDGRYYAQAGVPTHGTVLAGQDAADEITPEVPDGTGASSSDDLTDHFGRKPGQQGRR